LKQADAVYRTGGPGDSDHDPFHSLSLTSIL